MDVKIIISARYSAWFFDTQLVCWYFIKMESLHSTVLLLLSLKSEWPNWMKWMNAINESQIDVQITVKRYSTCCLYRNVESFVQSCAVNCTVHFGILLVIFFLRRSLFDSYYFIILTDISHPVPSIRTRWVTGIFIWTWKPKCPPPPPSSSSLKTKNYSQTIPFTFLMATFH